MSILKAILKVFLLSYYVKKWAEILQVKYGAKCVNKDAKEKS